jgi:hypothetical protein
LVGVALGLYSGSASAQTEPGTHVHEEFSEKVHILGLRFDWGSSDSYGVFYSHEWLRGSSTDGLGPVSHLGVGFAISMATHSYGAVDAVMLGPLLRSGIAGDAMAVTLEFHPGLALADDGARGFSTVALMLGYQYFGIGYAYGFPMFPFGDRPEWLSGSRFALRGGVPLHAYDLHETRTVTPVD